jgi:hypothetical protein
MRPDVHRVLLIWTKWEMVWRGFAGVLEARSFRAGNHCTNSRSSFSRGLVLPSIQITTVKCYLCRWFSHISARCTLLCKLKGLFVQLCINRSSGQFNGDVTTTAHIHSQPLLWAYRLFARWEVGYTDLHGLVIADRKEMVFDLCICCGTVLVNLQFPNIEQECG